MAIWVGQNLHPKKPLYNMAFYFLLEGAIDPNNFKHTWQTLVDTNQILSSVVIEHEGSPYLKARGPESCSTQILDFTNENDPKAFFANWAKKRCSIPLSLEGHLVDSVLVKLGESSYGWYLNQHHIITDASSTLNLYNSFIAHFEQSSLTLNPNIENAATKSPPDISKAKEYWINKKQNHNFTTHFYGIKDHIVDTRSERIGFTLTAEQSNRLKQAAQEAPFESFFPDMSLFACFATVLIAWQNRSSNQSELSFDTPVQLRPTTEAKSALGMFIEMFPFITSLDENETFLSLGQKCLRETQQLLTYAHSGSNQYEEHKASNVILNFFPSAFNKFENIDSQAKWIHSGHSDNIHGVRLQIHDYNQTGHYTIEFDFNETLFSTGQRERAINHFQQILNALLETPEQTISSIPILQDVEQIQQVEHYNDTENAPLPELSVITRIQRQIELTPNSIALEEPGQCMTFQQLGSRINTLAGILSQQNPIKGHSVIVYMTRSIDAVIAILAILKAGGSYVPIDSKQPTARISKINEDSKAQAILTQRHLIENIQSLDNTVLCIEDLKTSRHTRLEIEKPSLTDIAYTIYTSGSTGTPKGVPITHMGLSAYLTWAEVNYTRGEILDCPLFTSLSFDLTLTSLFLPLLTGGRLIIYPENSSLVDSALIDVINENRVHFIKLTPSHLRLLMQMDLKRSQVRRMVVGGEDFPLNVARSIQSIFAPSLEIYNEYGPTEAVVGCMIHRFDPKRDYGSEMSVPIGTPGNYSKIYVLNKSLQPVPQGVSGELCIASPNLTQGYLNQAALNNQKFVSNPNNPTERIYRSGDLARFINNSELTYLGRMDRQLKRSGVRIESGEIEAELMAYPSVTSATIIAHTSKTTPVKANNLIHCKECGLPSNFPNVVFDENEVCSICYAYKKIQPHAEAYFKTPVELAEIFESSDKTVESNYDCMLLLSGGKDSTYALCQLVDMGLKVYAFTLDNGYISQDAKDNISRVVGSLGVDHEFASTPAMNMIFKDSLTRFSNVCNGCFKTVYTLAMNHAKKLNIPIIVTGLSRGQFFETRLTENIFVGNKFSNAQVDRAVLEARKVYHRIDDAAAQALDTTLFKDDQIFKDVRIVDFYRYWDVSLTELISYLEKRIPWVRPTDTGRSTNCLINDVGIYIHKKERGYHNYALPYSWDVRMGHKTRAEALEELNDSLDSNQIEKMLGEIDYDENRLNSHGNRPKIVAYYTSAQPVSNTDLNRHLATRLPSGTLPNSFIHVDEIPLTSNGKIDEKKLMTLLGDTDEGNRTPHIPIEDPTQRTILNIWQQALGIQNIGANDNFFELGGSSLLAMETTLKICQQFEVDLPLHIIFQQKTIAKLADSVEVKILEEIEGLSDQAIEGLLQEGSDS